MHVMVASCECTRFGKQLMAWSEEDIVRALARVGTKGLPAATLAKAISAALFAPKVQRKVSNGVAGLGAAGSAWIGRDRGQLCRLSDVARRNQRPHGNACWRSSQ